MADSPTPLLLNHRTRRRSRRRQSHRNQRPLRPTPPPIRATQWKRTTQTEPSTGDNPRLTHPSTPPIPYKERPHCLTSTSGQQSLAFATDGCGADWWYSSSTLSSMAQSMSSSSKPASSGKEDAVGIGSSCEANGSPPPYSYCEKLAISCGKKSHVNASQEEPHHHRLTVLNQTEPPFLLVILPPLAP